MLKELFPRAHTRHASASLLGSSIEGFASWMHAQSYPRVTIRRHIRAIGHVDRALQSRGRRSLREVTREELRTYAREQARADPQVAATARAIERYLDDRGVLPRTPPPPPIATPLGDYRDYLDDVRGLARSTIACHVTTLAEFLQWLDYASQPARLATLSVSDLEGFISAIGKRLSRATLQHAVAHLRAFLRFLAARGAGPVGLETQIDTPRVYRLEQLPRALPWPTVQAFLRAIDRTTARGRRDYAMFLLVATYGLRASEIVALTLDDIEWRAGRLRVVQGKTDTRLLLPLMDEVGAALLDYLRHGRPALAYRELFLRVRPPAGILKPTALCEAFQACARRSGLAIPFHGPHCLRHSYAVHLLRQGTALKTIGDVLGHRSTEATSAYLRLAVEDLRDVALDLPHAAVAEGRS